MVTVCPMCQMNLDAYQNETNRHFHTDFKMPIVFFTQLMGLAFGLPPQQVGFGRELVSAREALRRSELSCLPATRKRKNRLARKAAGCRCR